MISVRMPRPVSWLALALLLLPALARHSGAAPPVHRLELAPRSVSVPSGILHDRVVSLAPVSRADGSPGAEPVPLDRWRQMYHEMRRAALEEPPWPPLPEITRRGREALRRGLIPIAVMNVRHDRLSPDALATGAVSVDDGRLAIHSGDALIESRLVALTALSEHTYRGGDVQFIFDRDWYFSNDPIGPGQIEIDFDDGRGFRFEARDGRYRVRYERPGDKVIRIRLHRADGSVLHASAPFEVVRLVAPTPQDTLAITGTIPYQGGVASGEGYVYLADGHASIENPIIVVEGFDFEDTLNWDELYELMNREDLLETIRALGFDLVMLNFTTATDYLQRNSFVVVELIQQVNALLPPGRTIAIVGASMGGVCSRYALTYMESHGLDHNTRTFVSFDSPQRGASIPLGLQYWLAFFADDSAEAAALLASLDSPGARQMLAYHHTDPPAPTGTPDPLRADFLADLAGLGDWPDQPRLVAVSNGSSTGLDQGYAAGAQIIRWEYRSFLLDITGNVWSVPDAVGGTIFEGLFDIILLPPEEQIVSVSGTDPFDNAPGGFRPSMAQMDTVEAPYGDIIALHDNHCFIPTISALALETDDLFHDVAGDPDLLSITPFDAVYFPLENQEHVAVTPENKEWFLAEIQTGVIVVPAPAPVVGLPVIGPVVPNPIVGATRVSVALDAPGPTRLSVFDVAGREAAVVASGYFRAGESSLVWDGTDATGQRLAPGVYFLRLTRGDRVMSRKITLR